MSTLYMMVGIPASGKSTKTAELIRKGAIAISSDTIREEIFGDANITFTENWLAEQGYDGSQDKASKEFLPMQGYSILFTESVRKGCLPEKM